MIKEEEVVEIMNDKLLNLFHKLIELKPVKINKSSFYYDLNGDIVILQVSEYREKYNYGYRFPKLVNTAFWMGGPWDLYFPKETEQWTFTISIPQIDESSIYSRDGYRNFAVPLIDKVELLDIKKKLWQSQQDFELTVLDKYLN